MKTMSRVGHWKCRLLVGALLLACSSAHANVWCQLAPGWSLVTHGNRGDNVFILGQFVGAPNPIWIQIASSQVGKNNVAMALGAHYAGRTLSFYFESPSYTCANFPSWAPMGEVLHVRAD